MSRKSKNKNVTSIAIKLNSIFVRDLFFKFLLIDIFIVIGFIWVWCIESELSFYGEFVKNAQRSVNFYPIETATYKVIFDNGSVMIKEASTFLNLLIRVIAAIGIIELIMLLNEMIFGTSKNRRVLKPLNEIAETASRLSDMAFDEQKFQSLEDTIAKISPVTSDERIHIGDN